MCCCVYNRAEKKRQENNLWEIFTQEMLLVLQRSVLKKFAWEMRDRMWRLSSVRYNSDKETKRLESASR